MTQPFVHLHLHSQYSLLDGAIKIDPLFDRAKALGMPAVGLTDHGNLFGAIEFYESALRHDVKPIIGCEVYLASGSRLDKEARDKDASGFDAINHLLLLAMNETGYQNLCQLVSRAYLEGFYYKPRIDLDLLREHSAGLIATSGCLSSMVCRAISGGQLDTAWRRVEDFSTIFKDRFYLEMQRHGIGDQDRVNAELLKMASDLNLPLLATNDAHYLEHHDHEHHDALLCIGTAANLDDPNRFRFDGHGFYVKSGDEMMELFHDHPSAVTNSLEIAERCNLALDVDPSNYHLPEFQVPAGTTREKVMAANSWRGLRERLQLAADEPIPPRYSEYVKRMEHELGVINGMGFAGYFLIVADFIAHAKQTGVPVGPGRGSSAGSLVAFSLGITGVDPIEYDIIFERFLNPERVTMPDIDVDFCMKGRDDVIRYVADKYDGEGIEGKRVAQIITFGKLQARAAIRDVGRVMGMAYGDVDRIAKLVPETLGITLEEALEQSPELRSRCDADGQVDKLLTTARRLEGLTRHASTHAAGVVIGTSPLIETVPLYRDAKSGDVMTQFDMRCIEKVGLIKFDFLGLKTLTTIADAERRVRETREPDFSIETAALDDAKTYELLSSGNTEGVFQIESAGMTELVTKLRPGSFKELIPIVALYRPGPLGSGMVDDFVSRRHGLTRIEYLLPELEEITAETLGVIVYQDQVLQIANRLAGYSLGEADLLRRAMGKKKAEEMDRQRERFVTGATERGIDEKKAHEVFDLMAEFAGYGFAKSHSAAYALITYQTAYLKANYPKEYLAALMTTESGNHDKLGRYIAHAQNNDIAVLAPDINESARDFTVVAEGIRFGLAGVKNVGEGAIESVLDARGEGEPFTSIFDLAARVSGKRMNRRVVESLVKCGAMDSLHESRAGVWAGLDAALEAGASQQRDRAIGQESLFGPATGAVVAEPALPDAPDWTDRQRLEYEKEVLGFYVSGHPLSAYADQLARFVDTRASETEGKDGRDVRAGGILTAVRETRTRRGALMAFATLEDLEGSFDLVIFAEPFAQYGGLLKAAVAAAGEEGPTPLLISGTLEGGDPPKILVREVLELARADERLASQLLLRVTEAEASRDRLLALKQILGKHPGECRVSLHLVIPDDSETVIALPGPGVRPGKALQQDLVDLFGRDVSELTF
ncbi:MAG: DNA polymerase III subunit alpha [Deltaproteobacteria bacterium]|nr:DNA polymerase III subunit alpha [Deltaproteobacteria bacterium]MBW2360432.1 DNA polymerase III subunit alpha [Deltaproteobacteria bacterium]